MGQLKGAALEAAKGAEEADGEVIIVLDDGPDHEGEDLVNKEEEDAALFPMGFEPDFGVVDLPVP